jgi:hypothetical protein
MTVKSLFTVSIQRLLTILFTPNRIIAGAGIFLSIFFGVVALVGRQQIKDKRDAISA